MSKTRELIYQKFNDEEIVKIRVFKKTHLLKLSNCNIYFPPENIFLLKKLQYIYLDNNFIVFFPIQQLSIENLKILNLNNNWITIIPPEISKLVNLRELYLESNMITVLPPEIGELKKLKILNVSKNFIEKIPSTIGNCKKLKILNLSCNKIYFITPSIGGCIKLETLYIAYNKLVYLVNTLPPNLKILMLNNNFIKNIQSYIFSSLKNLNLLSISKNKLKSINLYEKNFSIKTLNIGDNDLQDYSFLSQFENLELLQIGNNSLQGQKNLYKTIPSVNSKCICFTSIRRVLKLPKAMFNEHLKVLGVISCNLNTIPSDICNATNLKMLFVQYTNLKSLPPEIGLTNLNGIDVSFNKLTTLPSEIINLRNLSYFKYTNNNIILSQLPINIQRYLQFQKNFYADSQNVHNHQIQEATIKSVHNIINSIDTNKKTFDIEDLREKIINNKILEKECQDYLVNMMKNEITHSILLITLSELLYYILQFIENLPEKDEIVKTINFEIVEIIKENKDTENVVCFTGHFTRLINCLSGYTDLVVIKMSDNLYISNIIIFLKNKLIQNSEYSVEKHKELSYNALVEHGLKQEEIEEWLNYID